MADNSVDAAAARREARRRKILANSENRLKKITGRGDGNEKEENMIEHLNDPVSDSSESERLSNKINKPHDVDDSTVSCDWGEGFSAFESQIKLLDQLVGDSEVEVSNPHENCEPGLLVSFFATKLHLVILAFIVRLVYSLQYSYTFGESIFIPFGLTEVMLILLKLTGGYESSFGNMLRPLLLLSGISPEKVTAFINCVNFTTLVGKDFSVYFVSFAIFHSAPMWPG